MKPKRFLWFSGMQPGEEREKRYQCGKCGKFRPEKAYLKFDSCCKFYANKCSECRNTQN